MKKLLSTKRFQAGFTLIELLIVIVIISIVVGVGAVSYSNVARNSRNAQRASDLQKIAEALEMYYADNGRYPDTNNLGQFETAGRSCTNDKICCLLGGSIGPSVMKVNPSPAPLPAPATIPACPKATKVYIANGEQSKLPFDRSYHTISDTEAAYAYASNNGQSYVLVTRHYEGTAPQANRFTLTSDSYYWNRYLADQVWGPSQVVTGREYVVRSPTKPPS